VAFLQNNLQILIFFKNINLPKQNLGNIKNNANDFSFPNLHLVLLLFKIANAILKIKKHDSP